MTEPPKKKIVWTDEYGTVHESDDWSEIQGRIVDGELIVVKAPDRKEPE